MPPRQGTGHINWGDFVNANRGSATRIAGELLKPVEEAGQNATSTLSGLQSGFNDQLAGAEAAASQPGAPWKGPNSIADINPGMGIPGLPTGFEYGQEAARKASQGSRQLADIYGRQGLLASMYGASPGYGAGSSAFDSALLGSVGQGRFEGARKAYGGLSDSYRSALGQSATAANEAAARARERGRNAPAAPAPTADAGGEDAWGRFARGPGPDESADAPWLNRPRRRKEGEIYG